MDRKPIYRELEKKAKNLSNEDIYKGESIERITKEVHDLERKRSSADFTLVRNLAKEVLSREIQRRQDESQNKDQRGHPGVFIAARKIKNEGEISSEGPGARTDIISEDYKGTGEVKAKDNLLESEENWFSMSNPWIYLIIGVAILVIAKLILDFLTK